MPNWDFEANMLSDRWPTTFQSIWHPHSWKSTVVKLSSDFHSNLSWVVNFFKHLVYILHDFCFEIVHWGSSFQSKFLCEYFKLVKYLSCFITIWSILKMMITSVFSNVWRETSNHGIRNQLVLRRLWYIFYTILLHVFLRIWSISNWMLSLVPTFFKYGNNTSKYFKHNGHLTFGWICQELDRTVGQKVSQNRGFYVASGIISTAGEDQKWHGKIGE
jgi:hypothetical protein